eukprot:Blabericola_migrator_1__2067@NODE_1569_length_4261_cov_130_190987_g1025_i0_p3_GENE_NODE_1569_length_4261_cov_130_190987_g1025_i0NODE_1569_length_4261_cov_130_190987_g1025_i0_p3_ORF_typecomplete_len118_score30_23RNA_pol_L_2/PF13656_6/2_3e22RNA_pol_L/PF01193_24/0_62RNA_pol_L/PF01193_24/5_6e02_NODE_1569_length_4261_cov_130_190987_g1025_i022622615
MSINYMLPNEDPIAMEQALKSTNLTFAIPGEDHTLGNALRAMLSSKIECEFAGYSIPHPTQRDLNFRLQVLGNKPAVKLMAEAIDDLIGLGKHVAAAYDAAIEQYKANTSDDKMADA